MPTLADVGCVGKITNFAETEDGRYLISLTGVARFQVKRELAVQTPYRMVEAAWTHYAADLSQREFGAIDRDSLGQALLAYAETRGFEIDWNAADDAPAEMLVNAVCAACPFDLREKQMLLEAESLIDRCETLVALLHLGVVKPNRNSLQ
jgi:Lon protease-like protein